MAFWGFQSFLLIICTQHVVTPLARSPYGSRLNEVVWDTQTFQHIAKFNNYEGFIVTAAVYRSFGCELRGIAPANPLP